MYHNALAEEDKTYWKSAAISLAIALQSSLLA
jgi:hypothetical protein